MQFSGLPVRHLRTKKAKFLDDVNDGDEVANGGVGVLVFDWLRAHWVVVSSNHGTKDFGVYKNATCCQRTCFHPKIGFGDFDARRLIADVDAADDVTSVAKTNYTRIQDFIKNGSMRELFDDKLIKRSTFAIAGLAAFGFVYSARKERTQDEITGPPLLPGGSAYETDFPRQLPSISDLKYLNPTTLGMQYKINVSGSQQDIEKMQYLASGVVGGNVDSTIYNSLPRLGRDPYSDVASRF